MNTKRTCHNGTWLRIWASAILAAGLLVVSLVLMGNSAQAEPAAGSISGIITYNDDILGDHTVHIGLITHTHAPPPGPVALSARSGSGSYNITQTLSAEDLPNGKYYVSVFVDVNESGGPPDDEDLTAWYDPEGDGMPNPVVVEDSAVTGIDIYLGGPWTPTGGPSIAGGQVNALAVGYQYNFTGSLLFPSTIYAAVGTPNDGGDTRVYKSTDDGDNWMEVFDPGSGDRINALAVNDVYTPTGGSLYLPRNVYAGGDGGRIYKSSDGGDSWTTIFTGTEPMTYGQVIFALDTGPLTSTLVYAGGREWRHQANQWQWGVVYRSQDGGANWTKVLTTPNVSNEGVFNTIAINPDDPEVAYAAGGENHPGDPALYSVIYWTMDGGDTWTRVYTGTHPWFTALVVHPVTPTTVYAGSREEWDTSYVFRSEDSGANWTKVFTNGGRHLAFVSPDTIYTIGGCDDVFSSTLGGDLGTWDKANSPAGCIQSFAADVSSSGTLYAGTNDRGVFRSTDNADSWEGRNSGIQTTVQPRDIDVDPQNPDKLFLAADCSGGWMSVNGGQTYSQPMGIAGCMGAFAVNPEDSNIVYGGAYDNSRGAVLRSEDGGLNFEPVYTATHIISDGSGGGESIYALAIAPSMTDTVYAAGADDPNWEGEQAIVVRSPDDGASWAEVLTLSRQSRVEVLVIDPTDADTVYAGSEDCSAGPCQGFIHRTTDGGANWTLVFTSPEQIASIVINPQRPDVLYANSGYDIYKTTDRGDHWKRIRTCCPSGDQLAIDPHVPSHVYLGGYGYIAESFDGGQTWSEWQDPINQGTPNMEPQALAVDNGAMTQTLYGGFSGLWYYRRGAPQPGGPMTITMWTSPTAGPLYANGIDGVWYYGLVVDRYRNWVADGTGVTVNYATSWGVNIDLPKSTEDGQITGGWMDVTAPGTITFTATADDYVTATDFVTMAFLYNAPSAITVTATPTSVVTSGETAIVSAEVAGEHSGVASDGTVVTFTTDLGTVVPTVTVTANGIATTTLTSGDEEGTSTITATTDHLSNTVEVEFTTAEFYIYLPLVLRNF